MLLSQSLSLSVQFPHFPISDLACKYQIVCTQNSRFVCKHIGWHSSILSSSQLFISCCKPHKRRHLSSVPAIYYHRVLLLRQRLTADWLCLSFPQWPLCKNFGATKKHQSILFWNHRVTWKSLRVVNFQAGPKPEILWWRRCKNASINQCKQQTLNTLLNNNINKLYQHSIYLYSYATSLV